MAYKNPRRQRAYMKRWRKKNPGYMREYYRKVVKPLNVGTKRPKAWEQEIEV